MSEQLRITIPLPPAGSDYMRVFEQHFETQVPADYWASINEGFKQLKMRVYGNIESMKQQLSHTRDHFTALGLLANMRREQRTIEQYMDGAPIPPTIEEIAAIVVLDTYFLPNDGDSVISEMKAVILKRFKNAFPKVQQTDLLRTMEHLDNVFDSVQRFYKGNSVSHNYMNVLAERYETFIPSYVGRNPLGGLDILMTVEQEGPKLSPEEAAAMEEVGLLMKAGVI